MLQERTCPTCAARTTQRFCALDRSQTVVAEPPSKRLRDYVRDDVIGGRYRIVEPIGKGAAAIVFATEHVGTGQPVAVKLLAADPSTKSGMIAVQRLFREARVTAGLSHAHVVRVFDVGQDDGGGAFFLAMERLVGHTLERELQQRLIDERPMSQGEAIGIALPILDALTAAHDQGLVHRDLKPGNVMLCRTPQGDDLVKVLDFGLARTINSMLTQGTIPGAPAYMSPEQCRGQDVDARGDLYGLGCMLYACVTCRPPFEGREPMLIMQQQIKAEPADPRTLTSIRLGDAFVAALMDALAKDPGDRPQTARAMHQRLSSALVVPRAVTGPTHRHGESGSSDPSTQARVMARLAAAATDPAKAFEYARTAMKLDPKNLKVRQMVRQTQARLRSPAPQAPPAGEGDE